ncbi:hypothetical protein [Brevibacterium yomogidense]|uniref:hypothetical protein n=1 Tax=Brevibacterium yomogidense TaxID=946573 RepID=UPI0011774794|nr:hypothetical protein [Brevibacterium yomogidense]
MLMGWLWVEGFRPGARLCPGASRRGARTRRPLRVAAAALAALSLLGLSGCSGAADAAPTVGPTAGADEPTEPTEYQPSLPPYTSEVDLSAEDEAEVEELLLLIDEFSTYTSDVTAQSVSGLQSIKDNLDPKFISSHEEFVSEVNADGHEVGGSVTISDTAVWRFEDHNYAMVGICYDYDHWGVVDPDTGDAVEGHEVNRLIVKESVEVV